MLEDDEINDDVSRQVIRRHFLRLAAGLAATGVATQALGGAADASVSQGAPQRTVVVLGATGHVGSAIANALLSTGHHVVAISRSPSKLQKLESEHAGTKGLDTLVGDVGSDDAADQLRAEIIRRFGKPYAFVSSLSSPAADVPMRILDTPTDTLREAFNTNFFSHVTAAVALIPALQPHGVYIGISGGLSDFVVPNMGALSMTQSALRSLYSVLAKEAQDAKTGESQAEVRMLALYGMVATGATGAGGDNLIDAHAIGIRVGEIVARPAAFPGPLLSLKARRYA
jgi:NAD(P)-dependent dehydrogenase (short-subunit alcohol dehydrogenase family)